MAKGRKLTTSRSERYIGSFVENHGHGTIADAPELREDEVWSTFDEPFNTDDYHANGSSSAWNARATSGYRSRHTPDVDSQVGGLSLAFDDSSKTPASRIVRQHTVVESPCGRHVASSAPVNVPDWSKIYRVSSVESMHELDGGFDNADSEWIPPHEYLAREYARSRRTAANSVFEGVGRTLKGRDMSRVRDAVWSQTGFNG